MSKSPSPQVEKGGRKERREGGRREERGGEEKGGRKDKGGEERDRRVSKVWMPITVPICRLLWSRWNVVYYMPSVNSHLSLEGGIGGQMLSLNTRKHNILFCHCESWILLAVVMVILLLGSR